MSPIKVLLLVLVLLSCQKQEKLIQTKMDEIKGQWKIDSFEATNATPSQWKGLVKSGIFVFNNCSSKSVKKDNSYCKADVELNSEIYSLTYRFDTYYIFNLSPISKDGSGTIVHFPDDFLLTALMQGKWELIVSDNTMIGKQIAKPRNPDVLSVFRATRK